LACGFYDCGDLLDISGQHHNLRHDLDLRTVLFIDDDIFLFDKDVAIADDRAQPPWISSSFAITSLRSLSEARMKCQPVNKV
jgi:hypothetical protein